MSNGKYEAILFDLDGTLVDDEGAIRPRVIEAVRRVHDAGVRVMVATGRSESATIEIVEQLDFDTPAIVYNGAGVYCPVEKRLVEERVLANEVVEALVEWARETGSVLVASQNGAKFGLRPNTPFEELAIQYFRGLQVVDHHELPVEYVIRVTAFSSSHAESWHLSADLEALIGRPVYVTDFPLRWLPRHRESPLHVADVQPPCRGKAEGLRVLHERFGIPPERVVAVGDATNDIPMFEAAGLSVAMGNAMPQAREAADRVVGDNCSDTLADLLDELFAD